MSKFNYIIDAGHGGMIDGVYQTAPNYDPENKKTWRKMWVHKDFTFFEGVYNRKIAKRLCELLEKECIDHYYLTDTEEDIPLSERVKEINNMVVASPNAYCLISIHSNAGGGVGDEIWTSKGFTISDNLASKFSEGYRKVLEKRKFRKDTSDGDVDKESNFYILRYTSCPAFLTENGFFDNYDEAKWLLSPEGIEQVAQAHLKGIKTIELYTSEY